jgi:hypothetical protein
MTSSRPGAGLLGSLSMSAMLAVSLLSAATLVGCERGATRHPDADPKVRDATPDDSAIEPEGEPLVFASTGVPHSGAISLVVLDPLGRGALTRDLVGGVRLWPALDGSREPLVVPIRDPRGMALASDDAGGWTLALLDAAGGARIVGVDASGKMQPLASLPPTELLADMVVLPGGRRIVAVGSDHILRLLDHRGAELSRVDQPGLRPASLRLAALAEAGPRVVAVTAGEFNSKEGRFAVELLPLEFGDDRISLSKGRQTIHLDSPPTIDNPALSPDGRAAVYIQRQRLGGATWLVVATQLEDAKQVSVDSQISVGLQPRFGLLAKARVLLDDGSGLGRVVDLQSREVELTSLRTTPTLDHLAATFAAGLRVAPASNWLAVHNIERDDLTYLGYEQIVINSAGLTPTADRVAWSLSDRIAVEAIGEGAGEVFEVPGTRAHNHVFVGFVDSEHLVLVDWQGGAKIVRWRDGELRGAVDLGSNVNLADLRRAGDGSGVMLVRTNLWQNPMVVELLGGEFGGRYLTHGAANLVGVFAPAEQPLGDWGAWVIDGAGKLHNFTLTRLREGLDVATALQGGEVMSAGIPEQLVIGADSTQYSIRTMGSRPTLYAKRGNTTTEVLLSAGFVVSLAPSPDGRRLAIVQQRDPGQILSVYDTASLQPLWAQPLPVSMALSWSDAGEALAVPASFGGVVLDGADGSIRTARCGLAFEVRHSPPVVQGLFNQLSVCDL